MLIYGLKACDTCRKVRKTLPLAEFFDVREKNVPLDVISAGIAQFGAAFVNTRSTTWRGLSDIERSRQPIDLLRDHPALMKRPLIVDGEKMYLGWGTDTREALGVS
ncbi:MAG: arsenate reductase [Rhodobacteraceae bacterium]|nr:arsenate reductase [Paracoccaceae bacterium]